MADSDKVISLVDYTWMHCPRACCRNDTCSNNAADMAVDSVVCQSWHIRSHIADFAVYCKTCLNESLEAVTDSEYKTVALLKKVHNFFADVSGLEYVCNKLS